MQRTPRQVYEDVNALIHQIESGVTSVQNKHGKWTVTKHFTLRYRGRIRIFDCWCGVSFASNFFDEYEDERRFEEWLNDHAACPPKGQS